MAWLIDLCRISQDTEDSPHVYSQRRDIWDAGVLMIQMLMGIDVMSRYVSVWSALEALGTRKRAFFMTYPYQKRERGADGQRLFVSLDTASTAGGHNVHVRPVEEDKYHLRTAHPEAEQRGLEYATRRVVADDHNASRSVAIDAILSR